MDTMELFKNRFRDNVEKYYHMHYEKNSTEKAWDVRT
ncbi:hypothetical protein ATF84_11360 [[Clostridium] innocuum]|nr:hypothetical protein ATF84_11360 [[Clostridium] innocuum]SSA47202.1 hypothetical protein SAMN04487929_11360 [[Clostridium] innocuum]